MSAARESDSLNHHSQRQEPHDDESPEFGLAVLELVAQIPAGQVMTYGDVAGALGSRAARRVGTIMKESGGTVPWWRVVRADSQPPTGLAHAALQHYLDEGTPLRPAHPRPGAEYRIDLRPARWIPSH